MYNSSYGDGYEPILQETYFCKGTEEDLVDCGPYYWSYGYRYCSHDDDVALDCGR